MAQALFQCGACGRLLWLAVFFTLTAISTASLGQEGDPYGPRGAEPAQSPDALRDQVRDEIKKYEAEIAKVDADIAELNSLLEAHEKSPEDSELNASDANSNIARLSEIKAKYEAEIAKLQAVVGVSATAEREQALSLQQRRLRAQEAQLQAMVAEAAIALRRNSEKPRDLPPLKNAEIKIFSLANAAPQDLAKVIDSIFSPAQLRLSIDDRTKSLVVMGDKESLAIVEALLTKMDQPADGAADQPAQQGAATGQSADRSVLLRVFWLADGLPEDEGQDPAEFLPKSVIKALDELGLKGPRLVSQTVNSLAVGDKDKVAFTTNVPAMLFEQPAGLSCSGSMRPIVADRAGLDVNISVSGQSINCQLEGSLATPLGHYMVLGTANSLSADPAQLPGMHGGELGMMPGGYQPGGGPEGGFGVEVADPAAAIPQGAPRPKFNQSRFAFVVQVIEATSYPAE